MYAIRSYYEFLLLPTFTLLFGLMAWIGFSNTFGFIAFGAEKVGWTHFTQTRFWKQSEALFPGIGKEFMPSLNEGSFLLMPTSMPHTGIQQNLDYIETLDKRVSSIPEVEMAVGKWGRNNFV